MKNSDGTYCNKLWVVLKISYRIFFVKNFFAPKSFFGTFGRNEKINCEKKFFIFIENYFFEKLFFENFY